MNGCESTVASFMQDIRRMFDIDEIENIVEEVTKCMFEADIPKETLDKCFNPSTERLLKSARATVKKIEEQQETHARFVFDSLEEQGAFDCDRGDSSKAFAKDITQYEKLIVHSMRSQYLDILDWAIIHHRRKYGLSATVDEYKKRLTQMKELRTAETRKAGKLASSESLANYYDHLINSSAWFD